MKLSLIALLLCLTSCSHRITAPSIETPDQKLDRDWAVFTKCTPAGMTEMDFWEQHPEDWPAFNARVKAWSRLNYMDQFNLPR